MLLNVVMSFLIFDAIIAIILWLLLANEFKTGSQNGEQLRKVDDRAMDDALIPLGVDVRTGSAAGGGSVFGMAARGERRDAERRDLRLDDRQA